MIGLMDIHKENWVFVTVQYGWIRSIIYGGPRDSSDKWKLILDAGENMAYPVGFKDGKSYVLVYDGKGFGRIVRVKEGVLEEVIREEFHPKSPIEGAVVAGNKLYVNYLVDASSRITIFDLSGNPREEIAFEEPSTVRTLIEHKGQVYAIIESFRRPSALYEITDGSLRMVFGEKEGLEWLNVEESFVTSSDGTRIHYFVIKSKNQNTDVAIVYGYGGFGLAITPRFLGHVAPFLEDGGVYVVSNLRGGKEYGEEWHKMGMRENKQNVFEDFKAVIKYFKEIGFKTVAWGRSNGGLLVSAVLTQNPELLDVALIGYPVIDMLRFHKLYIGHLWTTEYGNPDDPKDREFLLKYSPYHNVKEHVKYPCTLVYTGLHDDRVHPGHAFKFVARLKEVGAPVYMRVETESGHMGSSPRIRIRELADILAFVYNVLGLETGK